MVKSDSSRKKEEKEKKEKKKKMISVVDPKFKEDPKSKEEKEKKKMISVVDPKATKKMWHDIYSWEAERTKFQSKLKELDARPFLEVMRKRAPTASKKEIALLEKSGITSVKMLIMKPMQHLLKLADKGKKEQQLGKKEQKLLQEQQRLKQIYNEVATSLETPGVFLFQHPLTINHIKVETTTSTSTIVFTDWIGRVEKEHKHQPLGLHLHSCEGRPVALVVCVGRLAFILLLLLEGLSIDLLLPIGNVGKGGIGCTQKTQTILSNYLQLERVSNVEEEEEDRVMIDGYWLNPLNLNKTLEEGLLKLGHKGYQVAAKALWLDSTMPPLSSKRRPKSSDFAKRRPKSSAKYIVSPILLELVGETLITKMKILKVLGKYIEEKDLYKLETQMVISDDSILQLLLDDKGPWTKKEIEKLLNPHTSRAQAS